MIAYTYHESRSVQRITLAEARALAASSGTHAHSQEAIGLLSGLELNTPLAIVTQGAGLWLANVTRTQEEFEELLREFEQSEDKSLKAPSRWHMLTTAIPVLVQMTAGDGFPIVRNVDMLSKEARKYKPRSDKKGLLPVALVPRLSLYRYNPVFEEIERKNPKWNERVDQVLSRLNAGRGSRKPRV